MTEQNRTPAQTLDELLKAQRESNAILKLLIEQAKHNHKEQEESTNLLLGELEDINTAITYIKKRFRAQQISRWIQGIGTIISIILLLLMIGALTN